MLDYEKMYHTLFNCITDTIASLQDSQQKTEEMFVSSDVLRLVPPLLPEEYSQK